jgi:hypothetical protein
MFDGRKPTKNMRSLDWLGGQASCYADLRYTICEGLRIWRGSGTASLGRHAIHRALHSGFVRGARKLRRTLSPTIWRGALAHRISAFAPTVTARSIAPSPDRHKNVASPIQRALGERLRPHPALSPDGGEG